MRTARRGFGLLLVGSLLVLCWFNLPAHRDAANAPSPSVGPANATFPRRAARDFPSVTASNAGLNFSADLATSAHPVERVVARGRMLDERIETLPGGMLRRVRLVRSDIQANPLLVNEDWRFDPGSNAWVCQKREMFLADQLILQVRPQTSTTAVRTLLRELDLNFGVFVATNVFTVQLRGAGIDTMQRTLTALTARTELVANVEADGVGFGSGIPNDPSFTSQWGVHNTGQSGGTVDADVDGPELWDIVENTPGVVVAVLDSGLNFSHPDLQGITWTNTSEISGDGVDNDGNGRVDDVRGWDFTNGDNNPTDDHGHGSNVTGIMAANRNNGVGIAGMLGGVKILVCKILNASNAGTTSALIAATSYARQMGAPIMNLSLQNYPFSATLNTEFNACQSAGILLSICAGNQGVNNDITLNYPSCYQQTNIIAVGNHDRTDVRWAGAFNPSNYGLTNVDLFAPGLDILAPVLGTGYAFYTGTSQATPFVTAIAATAKHLNSSWQAPQIKSNILNAVVVRPSYNGLCVTGGRLNAVTSVAGAVRAQPGNDRDLDGFSNLFEYLAGTRMDTDASQPTVTNWQANGYLHLSTPRTPRPDAHLEIERSTNLVNWTTSGVTDFGNVNLLHGGIPVGPEPLGFLRLRAVLDP